MLNETIIEKLVEKVVDLIEELNIEILTSVGETINKLGTLRPTEAHKLAQLLMYGDDYTKIVNKLKQITKLSDKQINDIFRQVAIENQEFARVFYEFRGIEFIPYAQNKVLQRQVESFSRTTAKLYKQFLNSGFYIIDNQNVPIKDVYNHMLEKAMYSITSGTSTYQEEMFKITKNMAEKGIRTRMIEDYDTGTAVVDYASGYSRRLDSTVRMHLMDGTRNMSNELQEQFGKEFGADGIEVTTHENPAPDHEDVQGHQFSLEEYEKLQNGQEAIDYNGQHITLDHDDNGSFRPISTMNCYHREFRIVLGVSPAQYSQEQLDEINKRNKNGFEFEGKHYTNYDGTQLQRRIETKVREYKDRKAVAEAMGTEESLLEAEKCDAKISQLNQRYNELSRASGLPTRRERMLVNNK